MLSGNLFLANILFMEMDLRLAQSVEGEIL